MPINPRRPLLWLIIALLVIWILLQKPLAQLSRIAVYSDFMGYWAATRLFLSGSNPYDNAALATIFAQHGRSISQTFVTWAPPWMYLLLCPFALLDISIARLVWFVVSCSVLIAFADFMWAELGGAERYRWLVRMTSIIFVPSALALNLGQTSPMILAGLHGFLYALKKRHYFLAGAATYLLMIKPHVVYLFWYVLLLWIIRHRNYRLALGTIAGITLPCLFSFSVSPSVFKQYLEAMSSYHGPMIWATPTLGTVLRLLLANSVLIQIVPAVVVLFFSTFVFMGWHEKLSWNHDVGDVLTVSAITSIYAWTFDWVVLVPAVLRMLVSIGRSARQYWTWLVVLLVTQVLLLTQLFVQRNYIVTVWYPIVFGVLYWYHKREVSMGGA